jgi:hypothetical protein
MLAAVGIEGAAVGRDGVVGVDIREGSVVVVKNTGRMVRLFIHLHDVSASWDFTKILVCAQTKNFFVQ